MTPLPAASWRRPASCASASAWRRSPPPSGRPRTPPADSRAALRSSSARHWRGSLACRSSSCPTTARARSTEAGAAAQWDVSFMPADAERRAEGRFRPQLLSLRQHLPRAAELADPDHRPGRPRRRARRRCRQHHDHPQRRARAEGRARDGRQIGRRNSRHAEGRRRRRGGAMLPAVSSRTRGRPCSSVSAWSLLVRPPREAPIACSNAPLFRPPPSGEP